MEQKWVTLKESAPPPYNQTNESEISTAGLITFVDFLPQLLEPGLLCFRKPVYETYRVLIDRANAWLIAHPTARVKSCETVEFNADKDPGHSSYPVSAFFKNHFIRGLRMWVVPKPPDDNTVQQIGFVDLVPQQTRPPRFCRRPVFETVTELLTRFNQALRIKPLPGRIISIETRKMKLDGSYLVDPDCCYWMEDGGDPYTFLLVIRIYFDSNCPAAEEIGIQDFLPEIEKRGNFFLRPKFRPYSDMIARASQWCTQQCDIRVCGFQTVDMRCTERGELDIEVSSYRRNLCATFYLRRLRVSYVKSKALEAVSSILQVTYKTFEPIVLNYDITSMDVEKLYGLKIRMEAWIRATGAEVISAETTGVRFSQALHHTSEDTYVVGSGGANHHWFFFLRLFLNGSYAEPPAEMLPSLPQSDNGCVIM